jgi:hypothetical protein
MEDRHHPVLAVGHQHRDAVGGLDPQKKAGLIGQQAVAEPGFCAGGVFGAGNNQGGGMNLADGYQRRGWVSGDCFSQEPAVPRDSFPLIIGRKAKIQLARGVFVTISSANAAPAGAETVPKPAYFFPTGNRQPLNAVCGYAGNWSSRP